MSSTLDFENSGRRTTDCPEDIILLNGRGQSSSEHFEDENTYAVESTSFILPIVAIRLQDAKVSRANSRLESVNEDYSFDRVKAQNVECSMREQFKLERRFK